MCKHGIPLHQQTQELPVFAELELSGMPSCKHVHVFEASVECFCEVTFCSCSCGNGKALAIGFYGLSESEQLILDICYAEVTAKSSGKLARK